MSSKRTRIENGLDGILMALAGLVPLLFDSRTVDTFALPKWTAFIVGTIAITILLIAHMFQRGSIRLKQGLGIYAFAGFLSIVAIRTVLSPTFTVSAYGLFAFRMDGLWSWISYGILFLFGLTYVTRKMLPLVTLATAVAGFLISVYALAQYFGHDIIRWSTDPTQNRIWSTFGNPNFLASYIVLSIPLLLLQLFSLDKIQIFNLPPFKKPIISMFMGLVLVLETWVLALTLSRAAWLGTVAAFLIIFLSLGFTKILRHKNILIAASAGILLVLLFMPWKKISQRIEAGMNSKSQEWILRQAGWEAGIKLITSRPFFGYGADGYHLHFRKHMDESFFRITQKMQMSPVYPHNETIQIGVISGTVGLILYCVFLAELMKGAWKNRNRLEWVCVFASLLAVWINNQLSFNNITTAALFFLLAGTLLGQTYEEREFALPALFQNQILQKSVLGVLIVIGLTLSWKTMKIYMADRLFKKANALEDRNLMEPALRHYNQSITLNNQEPVYLHRFSQLGLKMADRNPAGDVRRTWLEATGRVYESLVKVNPMDATAWNGLGTICARLYQEYQRPYAAKAEENFLKAAELDPQLAEAWTNLGALYFSQNHPEKALDAYMKAKDINPYAPQVYNDLGIFYALQGKFSDAEHAWKDALELNPNYAEAQRFLQMLASGKLQEMYGGKKK